MKEWVQTVLHRNCQLYIIVPCWVLLSVCGGGGGGGGGGNKLVDLLDHFQFVQ